MTTKRTSKAPQMPTDWQEKHRTLAQKSQEMAGNGGKNTGNKFNFASGPTFDLLAGFLALKNCVFIGLQIDCQIPDLCSTLIFLIVESVILAVFIFELLVRVLNDWHFLKTWSGFFDIVIVLAGIVFIWIFGALEVSDAVAQPARKVLFMRGLRLPSLMLQAFRPLRAFCPELCQALQGFACAVRMTIWAFLFGVLLVLFFAVLGVEAFDTADVHWSTISGASLSLLKVLVPGTVESWSDLTTSLHDQRLVLGHVLLLAFIFIVGLAFLMLIGAVIVAQIIQQSEKQPPAHKNDKPSELQPAEFSTLVEDLRQVFHRHSQVSSETLNLLWQSEAARPVLEKFGTLEDLQSILDMMCVGFGFKMHSVPAKSAQGTLGYIDGIVHNKLNSSVFLHSLTQRHVFMLQRHVQALQDSSEAGRSMQLQLAEAVVGSNNPKVEDASEKYCAAQRRAIERRSKSLGLEPEATCNLWAVFNEAGLIADGVLDLAQLRSLLPQHAAGDLGRLWDSADVGSSGGIDFAEFLACAHQAPSVLADAEKAIVDVLTLDASASDHLSDASPRSRKPKARDGCMQASVMQGVRVVLEGMEAHVTQLEGSLEAQHAAICEELEKVIAASVTICNNEIRAYTEEAVAAVSVYAREGCAASNEVNAATQMQTTVMKTIHAESTPPPSVTSCASSKEFNAATQMQTTVMETIHAENTATTALVQSVNVDEGQQQLQQNIDSMCKNIEAVGRQVQDIKSLLEAHERQGVPHFPDTAVGESSKTAESRMVHTATILQELSQDIIRIKNEPNFSSRPHMDSDERQQLQQSHATICTKIDVVGRQIQDTRSLLIQEIRNLLLPFRDQNRAVKSTSRKNTSDTSAQTENTLVLPFAGSSKQNLSSLSAARSVRTKGDAGLSSGHSSAFRDQKSRALSYKLSKFLIDRRHSPTGNFSSGKVDLMKSFFSESEPSSSYELLYQEYQALQTLCAAMAEECSRPSPLVLSARIQESTCKELRD